MTLDDLKREAAQLSKEDQTELHEFLGDFVDSGLSVEKEWDQEISKRIQEVADGTVKTIPGDVVMREMRERFNLPERAHA